LPVPLGAQLLGKIKYGIACGELRPGDRLPSVRELAGQAGIAPMTVAAVYRELQKMELLEGRCGSGTFVASLGARDDTGRVGLQRVIQRIDGLLRDARRLGLEHADILTLVQARMQARPAGRLRLVFIGVFEPATETYAAAIRARLSVEDTVVAMTIAALRDEPSLRQDAAAADILLTIADRRAEVIALLGPEVPSPVVLRFLPAEHVRARLAGLDPFARIAVVSLFPEWLVMMAAGIERFAPHVSKVSAAVLGAPNLRAMLAEADFLLFATGAEAVLGMVPAGFPSLEYKHFPDPGDIEDVLLPMVDAMRGEPRPVPRGVVLCN
jgi:DNA-binding transcriptional regulator YhcF (GntR family)